MGWFTIRGASTALLALATAAPAAGSAYKITELGLRASGLNERGQVTGIADWPDGVGYRGFVYDSNPGGQVSVVWNAPGSDGPTSEFGSANRFTSLNDRGVALGFDNDGRNYLLDTATGAATAISVPVAFDWARNKVGTLGDGGQIYGNRPLLENPGPYEYYREQPYIYENGSLRDLGTPPGTDSASFVAVDHAGRLLVAAGPSSLAPREAYIYQNGIWTHVGSFAPLGFNDRGDVIGGAAPYDGFQTRMLLAPAGGGPPIDLGTTIDGTIGVPWRAFSINDKGEVVGTAYSKDPKGPADYFRAFLTRDGVTTDLNTLLGDAAGGWTLRMAESINDRGQILAYGTKGESNEPGYVLLTPEGLPTPPDLLLPEAPVPEPSALAVFGGLALALAWARRRGRA